MGVAAPSHGCVFSRDDQIIITPRNARCYRKSGLRGLRVVGDVFLVRFFFCFRLVAVRLWWSWSEGRRRVVSFSSTHPWDDMFLV